MLFNSINFLLFFPLVTLIYFILPSRVRWIHLLIASCVFYAAFIPSYILILFFTIIIDYAAGIMIEKEKGRKRKLFLILSLVANIGILAVFKYYNFFIENTNAFLHSLNITTRPIPLLDIILPIGLSFHTFQAMSYTMEVYRANQKAEKHFGIYALYVMFYPQLVAGPIERPQNMLHQFKEDHVFNSQNLLDGLRLMLWGFFKKVVIADRLSVYVDAVYNHPGNYHFLNLIIATLFFTIQIYCDFSGYSDIAIGAAKTMGFDLMINFRRPYLSKNIQEFWKKWHISLSTWFKDYLYISLGGNRKGRSRMYFNFAIVFIVSGFWHGANWNFLIWGALHALFIISFMLYRNQPGIKLPENFVFNSLGWILTFLLVSFAWIFFRANNLNDALLIIRNITTLDQTHSFQAVIKDPSQLMEFGLTSSLIAIIMTGIMFLIEYKLEPELKSINNNPLRDIIFCSTILSLIIIFGFFHKQSFIYFQF